LRHKIKNFGQLKAVKEANMLSFSNKKKISVVDKKNDKRQFRFDSGLLVKTPQGVERIRGTAYDPDTEKVLGAWGEVVIDSVEHYASVSIPSKKTDLDSLVAIALGQAMAKSEIKDADSLLEFLNLQLNRQRR